MARTITVELHEPTLSKQQAFRKLQEEFNRLANDMAAEMIRGSWQAVHMLVPAHAALDEGQALRQLFPSGWDHPLIRMIQGSLGSARKDVDAPVMPRFKPFAPVVFGDHDWKLSCTEGRWKLTIPVFDRSISVPVNVPHAQTAALHRLLQAGIPLEGRLYQRRGRWYFAATYLNDVALPKDDRRAVGVDLGRRMRAVAVAPCSNKRLMLSGKAHEARLRRYDRMIANLYAARAKRKARRLAAKRDRYLDQADRAVANAIVAFAKRERQVLLKFESFSSQTARATAREVGSYRRIQRLVSRKAELSRIPVLAVSAFESSQRCNACGTVQPGNRRGAAYRCACGYSAHADLNAARNIAQTALWSETSQGAAGGYNPAGEAAGTAASQISELIKGQTERMRSAFASVSEAMAHATIPTPPSLGVVAPPMNPLMRVGSNSIRMEDFEMASLAKDLTESSTKFLTGSLDNLKNYVDHTSEEMSKVDLVGVTRRVLDTAIENTKKVVKQTAEPDGLDFFGKAKAVADGSLEAAKEVVNVISEEGKKADFFGVGTRVTMEGIASLRTQVDLTLETTKTVTNRLMPATTAKPVATRAPQVTRVEIEHEKPAAASAKASK